MRPREELEALQARLRDILVELELLEQFADASPTDGSESLASLTQRINNLSAAEAVVLWALEADSPGTMTDWLESILNNTYEVRKDKAQ